jgi:dihydroorotate dehydrogenase
VLGVNLGKQRDTSLELAHRDYEELISRFAAVADYLAINVSSPNTPDLRRLHEPARLGPLLGSLVARRDAAAAGRHVPLLVKLSPDLAQPELEGAVGAMVEARIDGVIATNTTTDRSGVSPALARESGGLSGALLAARSTEIVRSIRRLVGDRLPIIGCGGVMDPDTAREKLDAGACLVQLYTGLVYEGPALVRRILREL